MQFLYYLAVIVQALSAALFAHYMAKLVNTIEINRRAARIYVSVMFGGLATSMYGVLSKLVLLQLPFCHDDGGLALVCPYETTGSTVFAELWMPVLLVSAFVYSQPKKGVPS